jgi:transcriptional regulator with XRE-family HTH domain
MGESQITVPAAPFADLGERIKASRHAARMSQQTLAVRVGLHVMTISRYERGEYAPPPHTLAQIAKALDDLTLVTAPEGRETLRPDQETAANGR